MLLAIVRSADTHAYQLLERVGIQCAAVRRTVIEALRAVGTSRLEAAPTAPTEPPRRMSPRRDRTIAAPGRRESSREPTGDNDAPTGAPSRRGGAPGDAARGFPLRRQNTRNRVNTKGQARHPSKSGSFATLDPKPESDAAGRPAASDPQPAPSRPDAAVPRRWRADATDPDAAPPETSTTLDGPCLTAVDPAALPRLAGREVALGRLADAVGRSGARPPLVVGAPGCGRTLLASHLASVQPRPVFRLDATAYEDDAALRADLETVAEADGIAILDELDRVVAEVSPACLPALTHAWSLGSPRVVTIVSPQGRTRLSGWLPGGTDDLDVIELQPLVGDALSAAVADSAPAVLAAHGVTLATDARLSELVRLADRFLAGIAMPARALDLLDLACARTVRGGGNTVSRATCIEIVVERSALPAARIEGDDDHRLLELESRLHERVVGHEAALGRLADLVRRNQAGFGSNRPIASVLLLGPSGVGKTEIAKSLATALFDREDALVRLDMSEYAEPHAVARIVGAPPGYIGFEQGGALADPLATRPHRVVLLDEIEKAHRDVHQLLLQIFDEGRLTDGRGRTIDFRHSVVILTSNLGADLVARPEGSNTDDVLAEARKAFPVELWNRIEAPLVLEPLDAEALRRVCRRLAHDSSVRLLRERGVQYALSDDACSLLVARAGADPSLGARPLRHLLTRDVESMLAEAVLRGRLRAGTHVIVNAQRGRLTLD